MSIQKIYNKKKINPDLYVNRLTGETLASEQPNVTSINQVNNNLVIINSDEYVIIDSKALIYIQSVCSKADLEKIYRMTNMVKGCMNLLHDEEQVPHSNQSLRLSLEYDESMFSKFMKRLHSKSVIYYIDGYKDDKKCRWIMLNPTLARKSKSFHVDCISVFEDLTKKYK